MLLLFSSIVSARELSDNAFASLLTCGPGNDFYTTFGHTALRICDSAQQTDIVFNYGTFDFNTPHFYAKFARGILQYRLSASSFNDFMLEYVWEGRSVTEQRLKLTPEELDRLYRAMMENYLPANRYYAYDFFLDNCATRVRDQIEAALVGRRFFHAENNAGNLSFRQLLHPPMDKKLEWWKLGIDLVLGARCDRKASTFQYMFLPSHLCQQTDTGHIQGSTMPLAGPPQQLLAENREPVRDSLSPNLLFWLLLVLYAAVTLYEQRRKKITAFGKITDTALYSATAIFSLLIVFLWFFTAHYCTKWNLNLLWANPLFFWMVFRGKKRGTTVPLILMACCALSLVICFVRWPQQMPFTLIPILIALMLRIWSGMRNQRQL